MSVSRRLDELKAECARLGIQVTEFRKKKEGKHDYVGALQKFNLNRRYPDGKIPKALAYMLAMESPMLCFRLPDMPEDFQQNVWADPNWIAQVKVNGCRMVVHYDEVEGLKFFSRNLSLTDYLPVEYDNIWLGNLDLKSFAAQGIKSFILDTEVLCPVTKVDTSKKLMTGGGVVTETNLQATSALLALNKEDSLRIQSENGILLEFNAFHLLELNGNDLRETPYRNMVEALAMLIERLASAGLNVKEVPSTVEGKREMFERLVSLGGEGVVLKNLDSTYHATESRHHKEWIKVKRQLAHGADSGGLDDEIDGWVTGFIKGTEGTGFEKLVGALQISIWLRQADGQLVQHHIANCPNFTLEQRKALTVLDANGEPTLRPEFYNKVVECDGNWVSARSKRLMHPRFVRFREDKSPDQCILDEATLNRLII